MHTRTGRLRREDLRLGGKKLIPSNLNRSDFLRKLEKKLEVTEFGCIKRPIEGGQFRVRRNFGQHAKAFAGARFD